MVRIVIFFVVEIIATLPLFAQRENNIWYLGSGNFIDFNNSPTKIYRRDEILRSGKSIFYFDALAPNSVVCDNQGNILFSSNGYTFLNRNFEFLPGSDTIHVSPHPPMPVVTVRFPDDSLKYYLFSLKDGFEYYGEFFKPAYLFGNLFYSVIDMRLDSGLGAISESRLFIPIIDSLTSKLVVAKGICGSIWVITHKANSNDFVVIEINADGIQSPVISSVGSKLSSVANSDYAKVYPEGMMAISKDYSKILLCGGKDNIVELFDFDYKSGKVSNPISLNVMNDSLSQNFGCFSPDGTKLYLGETHNVFSDLVPYDTSTFYYQFDISSNLEDQINVTKTFIGKGFGEARNSHMMLGLDDRIYTTTGRKLSVILSPEATGGQCNFVDWFYSEDTTQFLASGFNYSLNNPLVLPDPPSSKDSTFLLSDTLLCAGDAIRMDLGSLGDRFLWQDGSTDALYTITKPGKYWAQVERGNCTFYDTMVVEPKWVEGLDIPQDTLLCPGDSIIISLPGDFDFRWQDGSLENPYSIRQAGTYWVAIQDSGCVVQDTTIVQDVSFQPVLPDALSLCEGETLELDIPYDIVGWDDGSIDPHRILDGPGVYWLDYLDQGCLFRDSMQVVAGYCEDCRVYVPNIFSPNGDGHNDVLAIQTNCTLSTFSWQIWDRWGTLVFSTRDPSASWDGRVGQSMAPVGVYVFRMNGLTPNGEVRDQGTITLIR